MNREKAWEIYNNEEGTARAHLLSAFHGSHPYSVVEALVIWAQLPDCPPKIADRLESLRELLTHCPEFNVDICPKSLEDI
jgi:hypothetical protein